jgi:arginyl-tRNA synthetase
MDLIEDIKKDIAQYVEESYDVPVSTTLDHFESPKNKEYGDISLPCFYIAKEKGRNPAEIAGESASTIQDRYNLNTSTTVGPYLNIKISPEDKTKDIIQNIRHEKDMFGKPNGLEGQVVVIDFSHPNIAKPFGVGHLRSTVIGNALASMYEWAGCSVVKINHLGDWGKQFGLLDVAFTMWGDEKKLEEDPIQHLYELYVDVNKRVEEGDEDLDEKGREAFRRLEQGDGEYVDRWQRFRDLSIQEFKKIYNRLDITFDSYNGEAFFNDKMDDTINRMKESGILTESQGALIVDLEDEGLGTAIIQKSNGSTTYLTRDISAAEYRYNTYSFDAMLYVVGHPQELHFKQLFAILKKMDYGWIGRCEHVMFGYIKGMSTRKGTIVFLNDVLEEAKERVLKRMDELFIRKIEGAEQEQAAEDIGITAVLFSDMKNKRIKDIDFDWDRMLSLQGDTGPYLQNVLARIFGIFRKVDIQLPDEVDYDLLDEQKAQDVVDGLRKFPGVTENALRNNEPSVITGYLLDLAAQFHSAYNVLTVKGSEEKLAQARLVLFDCVKQVFMNAFALLGFRQLEQM